MRLAFEQSNKKTVTLLMLPFLSAAEKDTCVLLHVFTQFSRKVGEACYTDLLKKTPSTFFFKS